MAYRLRRQWMGALMVVEPNSGSADCCICRTATPCLWCWRPGVCGLPVSCPTRQPMTLRTRQWQTDADTQTGVIALSGPLNVVCKNSRLQYTVYTASCWRCVRIDEEAKGELRRLIRQHLSEELKKLRVSVDEQIRISQEAITKRLQSAEGGDASSPRPGRARKK